MTFGEPCPGPDHLAAEQIVDTAIGLAGTGKFTVKITIIGALILFNASFITNSISLIFPAASCDFNLSTLDQGIITATPFLGMIFGSYVFGCLADLSGRRYALLISLFSQGIFEGVSSIVSNYWGFLLLKFFSGFSVIAQVGVLFPYVGECVPVKFRKKILCTLEVAWTAGTILLPGSAWLIIPLKFSYTTDYFFFHSWSLFVLLYSLLSLGLGLWLLAFPETPKYLADVGDYAKLRETFEVIHSENTRESFDKFLEALTDNGLSQLRTRLEVREKKEQCSKTERIQQICKDIVTNTERLFKLPFLKQTATICTLAFCVGSTYFSFIIWFPELIRRLETFEVMFPAESSWICSTVPETISANHTAEATECVSNIPTEVYVHTLIIGGACLPSNILVLIFIDRLGFKFFIVLYYAIAFVIMSGLFFIQSSTQNLILSAIYESFSSVGPAFVVVIITEIYPTQIRATAVAFNMILGRMGGVIGNLLIGNFIDEYCISFIAIMMGQLLVCVIIGLMLPVPEMKVKTVPEKFVKTCTE